MEFGIACESRNLNSDEIILISRKKIEFLCWTKYTEHKHGLIG
jgi:hypothetical protein